jgi:prepilin-type N-terminal cleavage/methylation domain-containing protein
MLNINHEQCGRPIMRGFSLIEMMIAIFIGSLVAVGALILILSINQANSQNIQVTRIHQELRALASVISDEIKRSRRMHDPMATVGTGVTANGTFDGIVTSTAGCVQYGYQDAAQNDPSTDTAAGVNNFRAINLDTTTNNVMFVSNTAAVTCPTSATAGAVALNSAQLKVTGLTFNCITYGTSVTTSNTIPYACDEIDLTVQGTMTFRDTYTAKTNPSYTYTQPIYIRSGAVKTS